MSTSEEAKSGHRCHSDITHMLLVFGRIARDAIIYGSVFHAMPLLRYVFLKFGFVGQHHADELLSGRDTVRGALNCAPI